MSTIVKSPDPEYPMEIDLRNRSLAALWAWLWPGAGHMYQRRYAKGVLFMVCILSTYFFGFGIGGWRVVYASFRQPDLRLPYLCQVGMGLPALPALVEWRRAYSDPPKPPLFNGLYRPPGDTLHVIRENEGTDRLAEWHLQLKGRFELGTLFTMIAGLLNILAVFDAYAGPSFMINEAEKNKAPPKAKTASTQEAAS
jgi:hypothetical protein